MPLRCVESQKTSQQPSLFFPPLATEEGKVVDSGVRIQVTMQPAPSSPFPHPCHLGRRPSLLCHDYASGRPPTIALSFLCPGGRKSRLRNELETTAS